MATAVGEDEDTFPSGVTAALSQAGTSPRLSVLVTSP